MKKLDILKSVTVLAVSVGTTAVVGNAIKATTPEIQRLYSKILVRVGTVALTGVAASAASKYASDKIDEQLAEFQPAIDLYNQMKTKAEK